MMFNEQAVVFACGGESLVGILVAPDTPRNIGVVIVVGGPQYRAGSHRQFVLLARSLAQSGFAVLRFDHRGMGDSSGAQTDFQAVSPDIAAAIDALRHHAPQVEAVALWGLCDGASAALLYCHETKDSRVRGLCLVNPWVRSEASLARTHVKHYYAQRLMDRQFWAKLLRGGVGVGAVTGLLRNLRVAVTGARSQQPKAPFQQRMAQAWNHFDGAILLVLSADDYTAKEFVEFANSDTAWSTSLDHPRLTRRDVADADHTFSRLQSRLQLEQITCRWLEDRADQSDT